MQFTIAVNLNTGPLVTDSAGTIKMSQIITPGAASSSSSTTTRTTTNLPAKNGILKAASAISARGITPTGWGDFSRLILSILLEFCPD